MITAPNLAELSWLEHGFGLRDSSYPEGIRLVRQIHSDIVLDASGKLDPCCEGDALVSNLRGVSIGVKTADCVPILLADAETRSIAAVHAGWRGTATSIVSAAVREMSRRFGARPETVRAAIGPAIGVCCYEVGPEVAQRLGIDSTGPVHLDLGALNQEQLRSCGVRDIWISGECTFCHPDRFFSWRRNREQAGRMISWIGLV